MGSSDKPSPTVIPQILLDCINLIEKEEAKFSWKQARNSKGFSLVVKTLTAKKIENFMPLEEGHSSLGVGHLDIAVASKVKPKRKKKSPSTVAMDRARSQKFWKQKKSAKTSQLTARQPQRKKDTVVCEVPNHSLNDLEPSQKDHIELVVHSQSVPNELDSESQSVTSHTPKVDVATEQSILVDLLEALDSDEDVAQRKCDVCDTCKQRLPLGIELVRNAHCETAVYCSEKCPEKDSRFLHFACSMVAQLSRRK